MEQSVAITAHPLRAPNHGIMLASRPGMTVPVATLQQHA